MEAFNEIQLAQIEEIVSRVLDRVVSEKVKPQSVTIAEAAKIIKRSNSYIRKLIESGQIRSYKPKNGITRISVKELSQL